MWLVPVVGGVRVTSEKPIPSTGVVNRNGNTIFTLELSGPRTEILSVDGSEELSVAFLVGAEGCVDGCFDEAAVGVVEAGWQVGTQVGGEVLGQAGPAEGAVDGITLGTQEVGRSVGAMLGTVDG
eukprot:gene36285-44762_t